MTVAYETQVFRGETSYMRQRITDEMLARMAPGELDRLLAGFRDEVHRKQVELWDREGVPEIGRRCDHHVNKRHREMGYTEFDVTCTSKAVEWPVVNTGFMEWIADKDVQDAIRKPVGPRWRVVGHSGAYDTEGEALAAAWSVTPAGGRRPEVVKQ